SVEIGESELGIGNRILRAPETRAAAANRRLRMTLRTAIAIEGWPQAAPPFSRNGTGHRINLHEIRNSCVEEGLLVGAQAGDRTASSCSTSTRPRIALSIERSCA